MPPAWLREIRSELKKVKEAPEGYNALVLAGTDPKIF